LFLDQALDLVKTLGMGLNLEIKINPDLPVEALVQSNDGFVVFTAEKAGDEYHFSPVTVKAGDEMDGFRPLIMGVEQLAGKSLVLNKAYYLFSEMEGGEGHHH
jgi:hypothetical protein